MHTVWAVLFPVPTQLHPPQGHAHAMWISVISLSKLCGLLWLLNNVKLSPPWQDGNTTNTSTTMMTAVMMLCLYGSELGCHWFSFSTHEAKATIAIMTTSMENPTSLSLLTLQALMLKNQHNNYTRQQDKQERSQQRFFARVLCHAVSIHHVINSTQHYHHHNNNGNNNNYKKQKEELWSKNDN